MANAGVQSPHHGRKRRIEDPLEGLPKADPIAAPARRIGDYIQQDG